MKRFLFAVMLVVASATANISVSAQNEPVLYFCERYGEDGEIGVSDRFTTGYITVMVKSSSALNLRDCYIQYDKYSSSSRKFEYYKQFSFSVKPNENYIYFERNSSNDMAFDSPGFYRVFLLDGRKNTVASALVEIISK